MAFLPSSNTSGAKSQYHHFIPRFILRNFACSPQPAPAVTPAQRRQTRGKGRNGNRRGKYVDTKNPFVNAIDLNSVKVEQVRVGEVFGINDMYRDASLSNEHELEEKFSRLESSAALIIAEVKKAFESGEPHIWLDRGKRDLLRKFLFLMRYRNSTFYQRYNCDEYVSNDKERMIPYMKTKGFTKPIDVWFHNIRTILDLDMDAGKKWVWEIPKLMYPDDAKMFILHTQDSFLAFCTPSDDGAEFLLTENAYGVIEGPHSGGISPITGEVIATRFTEYHSFAPLLPKLMIVLRSSLLPGEIPEITDEFNALRLKMSQSRHLDPDAAVSMLAGLPVQKCRNSYSELQGGQFVANESYFEDLSKHRFCFRFFPTSAAYMTIINNIFLEEACKTTRITFKSKKAVLSILESYFKNKSPRLKHVFNTPRCFRTGFIRKLETIAGELGGSATAHVTKINLPQTEAGFFESLGEKLENDASFREKENDYLFFQLYKKLGGSARSLFYDIDQGSKMVRMQVKLDVFMNGLNREKKSDIRRKLADFFMTLPLRRIYFYLKEIRNLSRTDPNKPSTMNPAHIEDIDLDGPEDIIGQASHIFRPADLTRIMFRASRQEDFLRCNPDFGFVKELTLDADGHRRVLEEMSVVFSQIGSIRNCGIPALEQLVLKEEVQVRMALRFGGIERSGILQIFDDEELVELNLRVAIRERFDEVLGQRLSEDILTRLKEVFFEILYPPQFGHRVSVGL